MMSQILLNNKQVNPMKIKLPSSKSIPKNEMKYFKTKVNSLKKNISTVNYKDKINSMALLHIKN